MGYSILECRLFSVASMRRTLSTQCSNWWLSVDQWHTLPVPKMPVKCSANKSYENLPQHTPLWQITKLMIWVSDIVYVIIVAADGLVLKAPGNLHPQWWYHTKPYNKISGPALWCFAMQGSHTKCLRKAPKRIQTKAHKNSVVILRVIPPKGWQSLWLTGHLGSRKGNTTHLFPTSSITGNLCNILWRGCWHWIHDKEVGIRFMITGHTRAHL